MYFFLLSICTINALRLNPEYSAEFSKNDVVSERAKMNDSMGLEGPLKPEEQSKLKKNPLMKELKARVDGWHGQTIYFIGDSTIRNQFSAFCLLLNQQELVMTKPTIEELTYYLGHAATPANIRNNHGWAGCKDGKTTAFFAMTRENNSTAIDYVMEHAPAPDVVYYNSGGVYCMYGSSAPGIEGGVHTLKESCQPEYYKREMKGAISAMKSKAPNAKFVLMLSHSVCFFPDFKENLRRVNEAATDLIKAEEEGAFANVAIVDGWKLTDGKCKSADKSGVHYNMLVLDELKSMMDAAGLH